MWPGPRVTFPWRQGGVAELRVTCSPCLLLPGVRWPRLVRSSAVPDPSRPAAQGERTRAEPGPQGTQGVSQSVAGCIPPPQLWSDRSWLVLLCGRPLRPESLLVAPGGPAGNSCELGWAADRPLLSRPCALCSPARGPHNLLSNYSVDKAPGRTMPGVLRHVAAQFLFHGEY